jgi:energy-coupling factor transporter ATP-binding protein EcfA2
MELLYLIGVPGAGKSTLFKELTRLQPSAPRKHPFAHIYYPMINAVQLGADRPGHSGTDALSMSVQRTACAWLDTRPADYVIAEGDRLGNSKFFEWCVDNGIELTVVHLYVTEDLADARRKQRGSDQNAQWLKGRVTKVEGLAERWADIVLDGREAPNDLAETLSSNNHVARVFLHQHN